MEDEVESEFQLYLIAKEFNVSGGVEAIKKWPFRKYIRYLIALKKYYEMQTGETSSPRLHQYHFKELD